MNTLPSHFLTLVGTLSLSLVLFNEYSLPNLLLNSRSVDARVLINKKSSGSNQIQEEINNGPLNGSNPFGIPHNGSSSNCFKLRLPKCTGQVGGGRKAAFKPFKKASKLAILSMLVKSAHCATTPVEGNKPNKPVEGIVDGQDLNNLVLDWRAKSKWNDNPESFSSGGGSLSSDRSFLHSSHSPHSSPPSKTPTNFHPPIPQDPSAMTFSPHSSESSWPIVRSHAGLNEAQTGCFWEKAEKTFECVVTIDWEGDTIVGCYWQNLKHAVECVTSHDFFAGVSCVFDHLESGFLCPFSCFSQECDPVSDEGPEGTGTSGDDDHTNDGDTTNGGGTTATTTESYCTPSNYLSEMQFCSNYCENLGKGCNDPNQGSDQLYSCVQACLVKREGLSGYETTEGCKQVCLNGNDRTLFPSGLCNTNPDAFHHPPGSCLNFSHCWSCANGARIFGHGDCHTGCEAPPRN